MRKGFFHVAVLALVVLGVVVPRVLRAACIDEFNSQKKFTSQECLDAVKNVDACNVVQQQLDGCMNPVGNVAGSALGALTGNAQALGNFVQSAFGTITGTAEPTCAQIAPFLKYFLAQCQILNPDKFCSEFGKGPGGCCITSRDTVETIGGPCTNETEQCADKSPIYYSCCYCQMKGEVETVTHMATRDGQTYESCEEICKAPPLSGTINHSLGAGALQHQSAAPSPRQIQTKAMYCFTSDECSGEDYKGTFQPGGEGCQSGEGRCIAPEPELTLSYPIGNVTTVKGYRNFIQTIFQYMIGIVGIVAAIAFVWGGFRYIFGSAFENVARSKEIMVDSAIGLILVFSAVAILRTINPATLNLNKLDVFMINKSRVLSTYFCSDIKGKTPLKLAKAGSRPDLIPFGNVKDGDYTVNQADAACGEDYYAKGFGNFTCAGKVCPGGTGICHKCVTADQCPEGTKKGASICEQGNVGGNITYSDCRYVNAIHIFAICESLKLGDPYLFGAPINFPANRYEQMDYGDAGSRMIDTASLGWSSSEKSLNKTNVLSTTDAGNQRFLWTVTQAQLDAVKTECQKYQGPYAGNPEYTGVGGFVIGIKYQDPGWEFGTAVSGVCGSSAQDEYGIIGKNNCGGGDLMDGYWEGDFGDALSNSAYKQAIWCSVFGGNRILMMDAGGSKNSSFNKTNVWTFEEMQDAVNNKKAIQCDFTLSKSNAFANPLTGQNNINKGLAWIMKNGIYCPRIR